MYRYRPPARVVYAAIVANGSSICIFKNPPTDAQGELMAAALDPANVIVSRERLAESLSDLYESGYFDGQNNPNGYGDKAERDALASARMATLESEAQQ